MKLNFITRFGMILLWPALAAGQGDGVCIATHRLAESWRVLSHYDSLYQSADLSIPRDSVDFVFFQTFRAAFAAHMVHSGIKWATPCWIGLFVCCAPNGHIERFLYFLEDSVARTDEQRFVTVAESFVDSFRVPLTLERRYSIGGEIQITSFLRRNEILGRYKVSNGFADEEVRINDDSSFVLISWNDVGGSDSLGGVWSVCNDTLSIICSTPVALDHGSQKPSSAIEKYYHDGGALYQIGFDGAVNWRYPLKRY